MELSNRLETIASFVTEGYVVADIGTDHGYIPIYLTSNGNCPRAYAMDVNKEPLSRAKTHIEEENAGEVVSCILSDGLHDHLRNVSLVLNETVGIRSVLLHSLIYQSPALRF